MERLRKPFQGVANIVKFNWHFYVLAGLLIGSLLCVNFISDNGINIYLNLFSGLLTGAIFISLAVSYYVYDFSRLYSFTWLPHAYDAPKGRIVNINAGFDEISALLHKRFAHSELLVFDFYDPVRHPAVSIKRARRAYPGYAHQQAMNTGSVPLPEGSADRVFIFLSAHEIRNDQERVVFFRELSRVVKASGSIIVTEHLRDLPNFLAYNIGFFHFLSKSTWHRTFSQAGLEIAEVFKITPFITTFILTKDGIAA